MSQGNKQNTPRSSANWTDAEIQNLKTIGANIEKIRKAKNIAPVDICIELEMNKSNFRRIERGESNVSILLLLRIATVLNVKVSELIKVD